MSIAVTPANQATVRVGKKKRPLPTLAVTPPYTKRRVPTPTGAPNGPNRKGRQSKWPSKSAGTPWKTRPIAKVGF